MVTGGRPQLTDLSRVDRPNTEVAPADKMRLSRLLTKRISIAALHGMILYIIVNHTRYLTALRSRSPLWFCFNDLHVDVELI